MDRLLETLRGHLSERQLAVPRGAALPPWELRFVLEAENPLSEAAMAALLGEGGFQLRPLFGDDTPGLAGFHLLSFPGLDRRLFRRAELFELGYALTHELHLRSAEPDLGEAHFPEPAPSAGAMVEGLSDLAFWCWVDHAPPEDREWALKALRVPEAWAIAPGRGLGIRVVQPDTGVAAHAELDAAQIRMDLSVDLVDGDRDATDPLLASAGNPGHGTGTASVLISGLGAQVLGTAPGAELVPIRCIESVAIFDQSRIALALDHARRIGAHVVTMSLGGVPSRALAAALRRAVDEGVIVLAAAGNCIGTVVWPARYHDCIAVAGTDAWDRPWRGSSSGASVDIAAPGELVWRAVRRAVGDESTHEISGGQGTSFATALTAGVVALWLSHHGRDRLLAEAGRRGMTLQDLCRAALAATARVPPDWNAGAFGAGIADAAALLRLSPAEIPAMAEAVETEDEEAGIAALLPLALETASPPGLDLQRFGLEVAAMALDAAKAAEAGPSIEAPLARAPSPSLRAALGGTAAPPLPAPSIAPLPREERGRSAGAYLRILGRSAAGASLESAGAITEAAEVLRPRAAELVGALERRFEHGDRGREPPDAATQRLRALVLEDAGRALDKATRNPAAARLDRRDTVALEAL
ncbi:MAG TPA: S8/S53 family peptidase, partial [Roseomonas sp.]